MGIRQFVGLEAPQREMNECNFVFLWAIATLSFGVGDLLTTFAIISGFPHVIEANPVMTRTVEMVGYWGIVWLKLGAFAGALSISVYASRVWGDRFLHLFPPIAVTAVGAFATAFNVTLIVG